MAFVFRSQRFASRAVVAASAALLGASACARSTVSTSPGAIGPTPMGSVMSTMPPSPDPRIGLKAGRFDAGTAAWNIKLMSNTPSQGPFANSTNSDLAFIGKYAIQGNYDGYQVWDISDPSHPVLTFQNYCPASQSDVSVYRNLLFVSAEGNYGRIDCGAEGIKDTVSKERIRGIRIFDITDMAHPRNVANVQTCRGSHTHTVLVPPNDPENVYVYVSGSAPVRSPSELAGCSKADPSSDPNSALFRIEVIKVPLAHPEQAHIVSSPRIFNDLAAPPAHGAAPADIAAINAARARGDFVVSVFGQDMVAPPQMIKPLLDSIAESRGASTPNAADSAALRTALQPMVDKMIGANGPRRGPTQCHDITVYPAVGLAGGACEGYGMLLDIRDPEHPVRLTAVSDSNFSYWHSATFNNDGTKVLFSDEWGGGGQPKCRASDPRDWGADAIFTIQPDRSLKFQSYYKLPAPQTSFENCVAHNGSMIPIPGRDVMVQAWYQGGISVFDFTDPAHPKEIAFFDRGPADSTRMASGGSWSAYWYNGVIVSSEISRGLDIFELQPSGLLSQNEIDAAKTVHFDYQNTQGQPKFVWPASFALSRAYVDQLERSNGLTESRIASVRESLAKAESASGADRSRQLNDLASQLDKDAAGSSDAAKVRTLASSVRELASK